MIKFFKNMVTDSGGGTNSKIFVGLVSFFAGVIGCFINMPIENIIALFTFSSTSFGWSAFDNKSAFQFKSNKTTTETKTSTSETNTTVDVEKIVDNVLKKFDKKKK